MRLLKFALWTMVVLIVLKLTGDIQVPWFYLLAPIWVPVAIVLCFVSVYFCIFFAIAFVAAYTQE